MTSPSSGLSGRLVWTKSSAISFTCTSTNSGRAQDFHAQLPGFESSPLVPLEELARELGVRGVFVKDESSRLGLPSFKILGASWGTFRAVAELLDVRPEAELNTLAAKAREAGIKLVAATEGNHGRAVARMAKIMALTAEIYVSKVMDRPTEAFIVGEGAKVVRVDGDYDAACAKASEEASSSSKNVLVQDTSFEGYEKIPRFIVEGYSTLLMEAEAQLKEQGLTATVMITPVGVGSLAHAVVSFAKSENRNICVIAVEPAKAACLNHCLLTGDTKPISTSETIMAGMNCGTVSPMSWPLLKQGLDASVTVSEWEAHEAVLYLQSHGVNAGPCGAATLAALRGVAAEEPEGIQFNKDSVVVLVSTEGAREYTVPEEDMYKTTLR